MEHRVEPARREAQAGVGPESFPAGADETGEEEDDGKGREEEQVSEAVDKGKTR